MSNPRKLYQFDCPHAAQLLRRHRDLPLLHLHLNTKISQGLKGLDRASRTGAISIEDPETQSIPFP